MKKLFAAAVLVVALVGASHESFAQKALFKGERAGGTLVVQTDGSGAAITTGTATATAGAATLNTDQGIITSESLTTAAAAAYTLTLTDSKIAATDQIYASVANGTNTQGIPIVGRCTAGAGSATILVYNLHASQALNGTIKISFNVRH